MDNDTAGTGRTSDLKRRQARFVQEWLVGRAGLEPATPRAKYLIRVKPLHGSSVKKPLAILCVPKRNPIVLASFMIEPHYTKAINNENNINHEVIHRIETNQGV
jgi:hypothetical protein